MEGDVEKRIIDNGDFGRDYLHTLLSG